MGVERLEQRYKFLPYLCDFYKTTHSNQYNKDVKYIYSNFVPRMSRIKGIDKVVFFGLQAFCFDKLLHEVQVNFFELSREEFKNQMQIYKKHIENSLGETAKYVDFKKYEELYNLGYLPVEIRGLKEGELVPIKTPLFEIYNTDPKFAWVTNFLESYISAELWYPITVATFAFEYRKVVHSAYCGTVDFDIPEDYTGGSISEDLNYLTRINSGMSEFGTRGASSMDSAIKASIAFLTSFNKSANVAAGPFIQDYYDADIKSALGMVSTEHSVMCSNFAIDGDEETFFNKLITEIYPTGNISIVADSYDYFNFIEKILPKFKDKILNRDGCVSIRPDSGSVVDVIVKSIPILWDIFGGTVNSKQYKVLDKHIRLVYGDSITINRASTIYHRLEEMGFAASNVSLGAGSFSMLCFEDEMGKLFPFTRDTFGIAIKATHCVTINEHGIRKDIPIFKDPKSDNENFKKSYKGRVAVVKSEENKFTVIDELNSEIPQEIEEINELKYIYFKDGSAFKVNKWAEINNRLDLSLDLPLQLFEMPESKNAMEHAREAIRQISDEEWKYMLEKSKENK